MLYTCTNQELKQSLLQKYNNIVKITINQVQMYYSFHMKGGITCGNPCLVNDKQTVDYLARPVEVLNCLKFPPLISVQWACTDNVVHASINFLLL